MDPHEFAPESLMMSFGYNPKWSEGAVKVPLFQSSTFVFDSAEEGKAFFEVAYGLRERGEKERTGLIYSRINNPNMEILENRLCLWDNAEDSAVFESGMAAISTVMLEFLKPGDLLVHSAPVYGGTDHFIHYILKDLNIQSIGITPSDTAEDMITRIEQQAPGRTLKMIYLETPANPTNDIFDIAVARKVADHFTTGENKPVVVVDNTYMGPLWSRPLELGADLAVYSATKYIGGHSDLIAGVVMGSLSDIKRTKTMRTFLGNMANPNTCWLLTRSLETLKVRMEQQGRNAMEVARYLASHPSVERVLYPGLLTEDDPNYERFKRQYSAPGAMISFYIKGGEKEAFTFLNHLQLFKLAVSLGSTESLAQHPASMTHIGMDKEDRDRLGITENMIRLSIGIEEIKDLRWDIRQALEKVSVPVMQ